MSNWRIAGAASGNVAEVDLTGHLRTRWPGSSSPTLVGAVLNFSENDNGEVTGTPFLASPESDEDRRLRTATDTPLDHEIFNYAIQNMGKHNYTNATMTIAWSVGALLTNATNILTAAAGVTFGTYAYFPFVSSSSLYCEFEASFSNQPSTNTVIDVGMFLRGAAFPYAPLDGAYFRLSSAGLSGIINYNGVETTSDAVFDFTYKDNKKYSFIVTITARDVTFWIDGVVYGHMVTPFGNGQPFASAAVPFSLRHANGITGSNASAVVNLQLSNYSVTVGGISFSRTMAEIGAGVYGGGNQLSGSGVNGTIAIVGQINNTNAVALVPTNTTAAATTSLGGIIFETDSVALTTDCIIMAYQNLAAPGRRLRINGVTINSYVTTVLATPAYVAQWSLAFGNTAVSMATGEGIAAKAPRRVPLGVQQITTLLVNTVYSTVTQTFINPIYIEPGQFVSVIKKKVGTTTSATGVIAHAICFDYSWE